MSHVLYRKYRSKNFSELFGQTETKQILRQAVLDSRLAHAYLFTGPRGTGKTSTARILAKAVNCENPQNGEPCNECDHCKAINDGSFLDLIEIDAASNRGIDEIRDLKEKVGFLPVEGAYKVYIIDEVHMLTTEAFNALLKTLEEPPQKVLFILATTEVHKLPATIISRTQRYDFRLATTNELTGKLQHILDKESIDMDAAALDLVIEAGNGSFRDAETVLEKILSSVQSKKISLQDVETVLGYASTKLVENMYAALINADAAEAHSILDKAVSKGINMGQLIRQLLHRARKDMVAGVTGQAEVPLRRVTAVIKSFSEANEAMRFALIPMLPLEMAIVSVTDLVESQPVAHTAPVVKAAPVKAHPKPVPKAPKKDVAQEENNEVVDEEEEEESEDEASVSEESTNTSKEESRVKSEVEQTPVVAGDISTSAVETSWDTVVAKIKALHHQMAAFLQAAQVLSVEGATLKIAVPYAMHAKKLETKRSQEIMADTATELFGSPLQLECVVDKELKKEIAVPTAQKSNSDIVEEVFADIM